MKKKSPRGIPDFSSKGPKSVPLDKSMFKEKPLRPNLDQPKAKPPSTTSKGGRRGG